MSLDLVCRHLSVISADKTFAVCFKISKKGVNTSIITIPKILIYNWICWLQHEHPLKIVLRELPTVVWIQNKVKCKAVTWILTRVSVQGVNHMFMPGVWFLWSKKKIIIIFQKEKGNTFKLLIIFIVKSLQKEQNSTNLLLWTPICRNKRAITPKWINS